jgi:Protein of unknown function (DUF1706)
MNKTELLTHLKTARTEWDALIDEALKAEANGHTPYAEGTYALKDIIAHVSWYERETSVILRNRSLQGISDYWLRPDQDARNEGVYGDIQNLPLDTVLTQNKEIHQQLVDSISGLAEEDIEDASRFNDLPWPPSRLVPGNSYEHYQQHIPLLRAWLDEK